MNELIISDFKMYKKNQIYALIILGVIIIYNPAMFQQQLGIQPGFSFGIIPIIVTFGFIFGCIISITIVPVHELSHFATAKLLNYPCKLHLTHVEFNTDLSKNHFIFILIAPLIVHLITLIIYVVSFPNNLSWAFIFAILILSSVQSDCYLAYRALSFDGKSVIFRNKEPGTFEVIPK